MNKVDYKGRLGCRFVVQEIEVMEFGLK